MRLALTSIAANVLSLIDDRFQLAIKSEPVLFIPTAANVYENRSFVEKDREALRALGLQIVEHDLERDVQLAEKFENCSTIFVAGGNTFFLLQSIRNTNFIALLRKHQHRITYIGSSAGAVVAGSSIEHVKSMDDPTKAPMLSDYTGLQLIDKRIIPHADNASYKKKADAIITAQDQSSLIVLGDNDVYIIDGESELKQSL